MYSAYVKRDDRTPHEVWCDAMVRKARQPLRTVKMPSTRSSVRYNNYTNSELKKLLTY